MDFECRIRGAEYLAYPPVVAGLFLLMYNVQIVINTDVLNMEILNLI